nr:hypothetical protein [Rhodococcus fascians]
MTYARFRERSGAHRSLSRNGSDDRLEVSSVSMSIVSTSGNSTWSRTVDNTRIGAAVATM